MTWCPICEKDGGCFCTMRKARKVISEKNKKIVSLIEENAKLKKAIAVYKQLIIIVERKCLWESENRTAVSSSDDKRWCDSMILPISFTHKECKHYENGYCSSRVY